MSPTDRLLPLTSDITRWRGRLSDAESTYSQGVAGKVAKQFEALLKALAEQRTAATNQDLSTLLDEVDYRGKATAVKKLPLGTVIDLVICLTKYDPELAEALPPATHGVLRRIVQQRNDTTHELPPDEMRVAAEALLDSVESVLARPVLTALLTGL